MNSKGQGALEYLLLIGGAILIAAVVLFIINGAKPLLPQPVYFTGYDGFEYSINPEFLDYFCQKKGFDYWEQTQNHTLFETTKLRCVKYVVNEKGGTKRVTEDITTEIISLLPETGVVVE